MIFDPIWFTVQYVAPYTNTYPFYLTHQLFWHILLIPSLIFFFIFRITDSSPPNVFYLFIFWCFAIFLFPFVVLDIFRVLTKFKPVVQKMTHVILGLFGMIISIWVKILCLISWYYLEFLQMFSGFIFLFSVCCMAISYFFFSSCRTNLYICLPSENRPFSGIKLYVVLIGIFHIMVAVGTTFLLTLVPACGCVAFLTCSFMFCVDAYSCFFTDSYILCEHRETKAEMKKKVPIDGFIQHVVVREMYSKKKNPEELPEEYQFDDQLQLEDRWYKEFKPFIVWKCQEDPNFQC